MSKISVIVPVYKCHAYLDRLLSSIAMQDVSEGNEFEVVLCDDCDGIGGYETFVERYSPMMNIRLVQCDHNLGPGGARTEGMKTCADSDYIMFCDSDDAMITDRAIDMLLWEIKDKDADVVCSRFIEELHDRTYNNHEPDMVWVFAKMYKNEFLKKHNIFINETRSNEDTGFNKLIQLMDAKVVVCPAITYMWHYQTGTITRIDNHKYTYADGLRGSFWNHAWAFEQADDREVSADKLIDFMLHFLPRGYFMLMEADQNAPQEHEENWKSAVDCYQRTLPEFVKLGLVPEQRVISAFMEVQNEGPKKAYPYVTYGDFLEEIGYYKDLEGELK